MIGCGDSVDDLIGCNDSIDLIGCDDSRDVTTCRTLGTPTEETWPGVSDLPDYKTSFPNWKSGDQLKEAVPQLDDKGQDILQVCGVKNNNNQQMSALYAKV